MEKDVTLKIRLSAEMKNALTEHAKKHFELSVAKVIRFLIANELSDEGIKLHQKWSNEKQNTILVEYKKGVKNGG